MKYSERPATTMVLKLPFNRGNAQSIEETLSKLSDEKLLGDFDEIFKIVPVTNDTSCGIGICRGPTLQKFANKKVLVVLYGFLSLVFAAAGSYFNATITTIEKRYKISSKNMGIISVGNDVSSLFLSAFISYYGGKSHRPRLIGLGLFMIVLFCLINSSPHFLYGPGDEALSLTIEYGGVHNDKQTDEAKEVENRKLLCRTNATEGIAECELDGGNLMPQALLFLAQLVSGIGQTLCGTLGISYMDDNIKQSKTPALMSISMFIRLLGPACGYAMASVFLKMYIAPALTPVITNKDPRWLGAWWAGWIIFAVILFMFSIATTMLPKELPRAAVRKRIEKEKIKRGLKVVEGSAQTETIETEASIKDMIVTFKRLFHNKIFMLMNIAGILHIFGFLPYFIYTPKIIETIYHQSASASSFYTGTLAIVFSGIGVLVGGIFISKFKPSARFICMYHIICGTICCFGFCSYAFLGCAEGESTLSLNHKTDLTCESNCHCEFVRYSPVCADGMTYISACHAGCTSSTRQASDISSPSGMRSNESQVFTDCSCVQQIESASVYSSSELSIKSAITGACPVNCQKELFYFLAIMCFLKFIGATGRTSNFLVSIRCVNPPDKSVAIGLGSTLVHLFALIPSPILFGYILDKACLVWGKTCTGTGNCWLYNSETLLYLLNFTAAFFVAMGTIVDFGVWYLAKDLKIFDDDEDEKK